MCRFQSTAWRVLQVTLCACCVTACSGPTAGSADAFEQLAEAVRVNAGHEIHWQARGEITARMQEMAEGLIKDDLDEQNAVTLALLNSNSLQARFETLSMVHGDWTANMAFKNPVFTLLGRVPVEPGILFGEVNFLQSLLEMLLSPWKRAQADIDMERVRFEVGQTVLDVIRDVRVAYHQAQVAARIASLRSIMLADVQRASELATFRSKSERVEDIHTALARATYQQMKLDLARAELDLLMKRESLAELLGLQRVPVAWSLKPLPDVPSELSSLRDLEDLALTTRMDIAAADARVRLMTETLNFTTSSSFVGTTSVGGAATHDSAGTTHYGPTLVLELPLFNRRQGRIERLRGELRKAEREAQQLRVAVRSRVRRAYGAVAVARSMAEAFSSTLLPLRRRITNLSAQDADANNRAASAWDVVLARQAELQTQCEWAEAAHTYWQQRAHLDHAVGLAHVGQAGMTR